MKIKRINESLDAKDLNDISVVVKSVLKDAELDQLKNNLTKEHTILADQHRALHQILTNKTKQEHLSESGQVRSNRFNTYKKRIERAIEKGDQETLQRTKEAIMYAPAKELKNSEADELMKMIKGAKLEEALTGYKLTVVKDGETFDDYACAYEEAGAIQQMKNKYGDDIEVKNIAVSKVIKETFDNGNTKETFEKRIKDAKSAEELHRIEQEIKLSPTLDADDEYELRFVLSDALRYLKESKSIKTFGAKGKKLEEARDPYFTPYGYRDAAKVLNGKAPEYYYHLKEIEMEQGDGRKLANYAKKLGLNVIEDPDSDPDYPEFYIPGEYHWNDYFYPYPSAHEPKLESVVLDDAEFERIDRSGTDEERLVAAVCYMYGVDTDTAKEYIPDLGDTQRKKALAYYDLRDLPRDVRLAKIKELYPRRITEAFDAGYKKGDKVELPSGQTGTIYKDVDYSVDDRAAVEIDGMDEIKYPLIDTLRPIRKSADETVKRYQVEFFIDENDDSDDPLTKYVYTDSKYEAIAKVREEYPNAQIVYCVSETVPARYKEWDLKESIEVATIADYITDHYDFDDLDDKYSCINSIKDSHKDTISKEELEQFIGAHNGKDKVTEDIDYSQFRDIPDLIPMEVIPDTRKWQYSVGGVDVPYTSYEDAKAHLKDDYNIEDYREELQAYLDKETGRPQKFFVDATFDSRLVISIHWGDWKHEHNYADFLVRKFFMDKGLGIETDVDVTEEDGSDTYSAEHYYQINDIALSGRVIEEDVDDVQYGVHQFSTDSIIFRGTEEECGKYIDNDKKLWDDAEVYRMTPDDPHYKKMDEAADKPLYIIKDSHGNQLSAPNSDDSELWDRVESMEARGRRGLMVVAYTGKKVNEASYGGAFDIEDDQYFTRDDLLYFADEVLGHVAETFDGTYDIGGIWFEDGCVVTQIVDEDGNMYEDTTKVDMRRIREPWHLTRMYAFLVAANIIKQIEDADDDVMVENVMGQGEYSDKFHNYFFFLLNEGKEDELPYLVSQLIRYCKEEDLKDLWHDRMEKVAHNAGFESNADELQEGLMDGFYKAQRYLELEIPEICRDVMNKLPDMTEKEFDVLNDRCANFHGAMEDMLHYMNAPKTEEALTESVTDAEPIETGAAVGMAAVISDLIKDEYEAIDGYNSAIATAEAEGFGDAVKVLTEIQAEENIHIGQLQEVMKMFDPNADKVEEGQAEGAEQLNNSAETPNNNIEESADMKKERWEEIYDSFKTVEKELNQDGEAVTAVVDQMYRDNKDDPDYKKAYDKWASNE